MAISFATGFEYGEIPKVGEKDWADLLVDCFRTQQELSKLKLELFDLNVNNEQTKYILNFMGEIVQNPGYRKKVKKTEEDSFDSVFAKLLKNFKIAKDGDQAKQMTAWLITRYKVVPYNNKCLAMAMGLYSVSIYLAEKGEKITIVGGDWEIVSNHLANHLAVVRNLFFAALLKGVALPTVSRVNQINFNNKNDFAAFPISNYDPLTKKCLINVSEFSPKKIENMWELFDFQGEVRTEAEFTSKIDKIIVEFDKYQSKKFALLWEKFCDSLGISQAFLALQFMNIFNIPLDREFISYSIVKSYRYTDFYKSFDGIYLRFVDQIVLFSEHKELKQIVLKGWLSQAANEYIKFNEDVKLFDQLTIRSFKELQEVNGFSENIEIVDEIKRRMKENSTSTLVDSKQWKSYANLEVIHLKPLESKDVISALYQAFIFLKPITHRFLFI